MRSIVLFSTLGMICGFVMVVTTPVAFADTVTTTASSTTNPETATPFVVFQMADGRYFNPSSGKSADSVEALRELVFGVADAATAPTSTIIGASDVLTPATTTTIPVVDPLVAAIRRAQAELQAQIDVDAQSGPAKITKKEADTRDITIAIWERATDKLRYVDAKKHGTGLTIVDGSDQDNAIHVIQSNGINSSISIKDDGSEIVVAIRYPVFQPLNKKQTLFSVKDVVYVPYSSFIHTPALVEEGETYLDDLTTKVFDKLRADGIHSRVFPDKLIADVVDPAVVKSIAAIEHLDQQSLEDDTAQALERFFVTLGANRGNAFNYARSSASALGLVQFIPSTYNRLAAHTEWKLDPNFEHGMMSHENAVRAETIYLDQLLYELPSTAKAEYLQDPTKANEFIVAAYNGGSSRVSKAMKIWEQIFDGQRQRQLTALQGKYDAAFTKAETLRAKTLKEKNRKKRAKLQAQLDSQRKTYRTLASQLAVLQASLLRKETIGYIQKYRLTTSDTRFAPRTSTTL